MEALLSGGYEYGSNTGTECAVPALPAVRVADVVAAVHALSMRARAGWHRVPEAVFLDDVAVRGRALGPRVGCISHRASHNDSVRPGRARDAFKAPTSIAAFHRDQRREPAGSGITVLAERSRDQRVLAVVAGMELVVHETVDSDSVVRPRSLSERGEW
jgi:hypothetical protein